MTTNLSITEGSSTAVPKAPGPPAQPTPTGTDVQTALAVVDPAAIGYLAFRVLKDPAIRKAWRAAANDCSRASAMRTFDGAAKAATSVAIAGSETAAAWRQACYTSTSTTSRRSTTPTAMMSATESWSRQVVDCGRRCGTRTRCAAWGVTSSWCSLPRSGERGPCDN